MKRIFLKKICAVMLVTAVMIFSSITASADINGEYKDIFTEEELEYIDNSSVLKVGYVQDRKPVSFKGDNGELAGISREIFDRISEISGLKFDYVELPLGSVTYDYLLGEGFDMVTSVEYNEENQKAKGILMSDPYLSSQKVIVAKDSFHFNVNEHYKAAISTGSQTIKKVLATYYPNVELADYPSTEDCFQAVHDGEVDLLIQNQYVAEYWLYKPLYSDMRAIPIVELSDQLCFSAVTPLEMEKDSSWHEKELQISVINKAIAQISEDEASGYVITSITENRYNYTYGDFLYQYRYTFIALGIALVLILILLYANMKIRMRSVRDRANAKAKGDFLSTMSHEIRTPLNGLIGLNYMMKQNLDDKKKLSDYLSQSSSVAQYLLSLVNNILDMSKLQDNNVDSAHDPIDLLSIFKTVISMERSGIEDKGITFTTDIDVPFPTVLGDEMRIQQIMVNILDNARKYTDEGGSVVLGIKQERLSENEIKTVVNVKDNGKGMSDEFQKKIFEPFTQERSTVSMGNQGTGLGMAICSMLAKTMGGTLSVKSKPGKGSTFTFTFVCEPADKAAETAQKHQETAPAPKTEKPKILIAEDNELNGQILIEILTKNGYEVSHAVNGSAAVEMFKDSEVGSYGIILMDLLMPELNGFEAAAAIRALDRPDAQKVTIIACTANSFKEDQENALKSGMNDFIAKPIDVDQLLEKLEYYSHKE